MANNSEISRALYDSIARNPRWTGTAGLFGTLGEDHFGAEIFAEYLAQAKRQNGGILSISRFSINPEGFLDYLNQNKSKNEEKYDQLITKTKSMISSGAMTFDSFLFFAKLFNDLELLDNLPQTAVRYETGLQQALTDHPELFDADRPSDSPARLQSQAPATVNTETDTDRLPEFSGQEVPNASGSAFIPFVGGSSQMEQMPVKQTFTEAPEAAPEAEGAAAAKDLTAKNEPSSSEKRFNFPQTSSATPSQAAPAKESNFTLPPETKLREFGAVVSDGDNLRKKASRSKSQKLQRISEKELESEQTTIRRPYFDQRSENAPAISTPKRKRSAGARIATKTAAIAGSSILAILFGGSGGSAGAAGLNFLF